METILTSGTVLDGKYRIEKILGSGGFGITYLATDISLDKLVAIKEFFPKEYCHREDNTLSVTVSNPSQKEFIERYREKFLKEARNIAKMDNPNIVKIYTCFTANETAYYVMEYVPGRNLAQIVKADGPMSVERAAGYIRKIGEALEYIHAKKINHLDVKPANILIKEGTDTPILIDFGLSKQYDTTGHQTTSTPTGISHGYAPLEQYASDGVKEFTPQSDVYSLAATFYFIITGMVPPQAVELINSRLEFPDRIPTALQSVIEKAMRPQKRERHETVREFLKEINDALAKTERKTEKKATEKKTQARKTATYISENTIVAEEVKTPKFKTESTPKPKSESKTVKRNYVAEEKEEKKNDSKIWGINKDLFWILVAGVIFLIAFIIFGSRDENKDGDSPTSNTELLSDGNSNENDGDKSSQFTLDSSTPFINEFFPIYGVTLGQTTMREALTLPGAKEGSDDQVVRINDIAFWDHDNTGILQSIYMVHSAPMPEKWESLGLKWNLTYNGWMLLFKKMGFYIEVTDRPHKKEYSGRSTLSAEFKAIAPDNSIQFKLGFNYGDQGDTQNSPSTLYSINVDVRKK